MKKRWKVKHKGIWYPVNQVVDSGKPAHEEGGGNFYHVEGHEPIHQNDVEDLDMGENVTKADRLKGGVADNKKPSAFDKQQLKIGTQHEMEHTNDRSIAQEIAMDHLTEDPQYYQKLKEIEKYDRVDVEADGKRELDYGAEELDKLKNKWKKLKKALDSNTAIMDLSAAEGDDELDGAASQEQAPEQASEAQQAPEQAPEGDEAQREQEVIDFLREEGYEDAEIAYIIHNHSIPIPTKDDHAAQNEAAKGDARLAYMQADHEMHQSHSQEAHEQERRQDEEEHKHHLEHKRRMSDVEYERAKSELVDPNLASEHKKKMLEIEREIAEKKKEQAALEVEHKKRMLELEYQKAHKEANKEDPTEAIKKEQLTFDMQMKRMEKELELEFKKKELAMKLKLQEEAARQKHEHAQQQAEADAVVNAQVKANQAKHKIAESKKPPQKEHGDI